MNSATLTRPLPPPSLGNGTVPKFSKVPVGVTAVRQVLNAVEGWGKTSYAAYAPSPAILMARGESGFRTLREAGLVPDADTMEIGTWKDTLKVVESLEDSPHKTVVLDAQGGFERLCHEHVCTRDFGGDWGEKGFGSFQKGYDISISDWLQLLQRLDRLQVKGKNVVILSHAKVKSFKNPLGPDFDRYTTDCHDKTWAVTHKWADLVLFGTFISVVQEKKGKAAKGIGGTERVIYTQRTDAYDAKNRFSMPEQIDVGPADSVWSTVWDEINGKTRKQTEAVALPAGL